MNFRIQKEYVIRLGKIQFYPWHESDLLGSFDTLEEAQKCCQNYAAAPVIEKEVIDYVV